MVKEFYKSGDCNTGGLKGDGIKLISAKVQSKNAKKLRDEQKIAYWESVKEVTIDRINQLWRLNKVYFWEEDWFPGYEEFLKDIQDSGYHVYVGDPERRDGRGVTQKRFLITLVSLPSYYNEWIYESKEENN